jgi:hypothetical protein
VGLEGPPGEREGVPSTEAEVFEEVQSGGEVVKVVPIAPAFLDPPDIAKIAGAHSNLEKGFYMLYACVPEEHDFDEDFPAGHVCSVFIELTQDVQFPVPEVCEHCEVQRTERMQAVDAWVRERALGISE